jgi:hypothetical protein
MAVSVAGAMGFGDITQVSKEPPLKDLMIETSARGPLGWAAKLKVTPEITRMSSQPNEMKLNCFGKTNSYKLE